MRLARPLALLGAAALLGVGCASAPGPQEHLVAAESSTRAAEEVGAAQQPQAALYLRHAQDETAQARQLMQEGDNDRAAGLLQRAQADAELALATARSAHARNEAQAAQARIHAMQLQSAPTQP